MTWPRTRNKVPPRRLHDLEANQNLRSQCWFSIPIDCKNRPEFVVTLVQSKDREGFQLKEGGKHKGLRRFVCREHLSLFQRPLHDLRGLSVSIQNLNPITDAMVDKEDTEQ